MHMKALHQDAGIFMEHTKEPVVPHPQDSEKPARVGKTPKRMQKASTSTNPIVPGVRKQTSSTYKHIARNNTPGLY